MSNQPPPIPATKKILIVDDDAVVVKALSLKLSGRGYEVEAAMDPSEAVKAVRKQKPDLILLDVNFPGDVGGVAWDGFRIIEWLRRLDQSQRIPVIVITGGDVNKLKARSKEIGAAAFFQKPVDNDKLLEVIRKTLDEWSGRSKAGGSPDPGAPI